MSLTVPVALAERSYDIHIGTGLFAGCGALIAAKLAKSAPRRVPVVTDETVAGLYYSRIAESLAGAGLAAAPIVLPPGEQTKSFHHLEHLIDALLSANVERGSLIVALGGGVIGDLTGFAAGILKRGVDFVQMPTTLLAQVDSSVGGKTAINTPHGKNLVGLFHQPRLVIADTEVLATLPRRELLGGYAEIVKYGLLGDADFFSWLERYGIKALDGDGPAITHAVAHSCAMKAAIVARDERETGERALLNLGHTFGHGLEAATNYSARLIHGEGVALGCVLATRLSAKLGFSTPVDVARVERHFASCGLPTRIDQIAGSRPEADEVLDHMRHDKKASSGHMTFILMRGIGHAFISCDVPEEAVRAVLAEG
ncbi:MAG TPA: 3-dehydroquinate synthase [Micropepsaceae bacterium]|nr:3-dehydroquinate synthase [Micropepsaceae bacterium]